MLRLATWSTLAVAVLAAGPANIRGDMSQFISNDGMYVPKDPATLLNEISPEKPLLILVRHGLAGHNGNDDFNHLYKVMKKGVELSRDQRLALDFFDPDLTPEGVKQAEALKTWMDDHNSGWSQVLQAAAKGDIVYVCSPQARAIQTALSAFPDQQFIVDDGVRERISSLGSDMRRAWNTGTLIVDKTEVDSIEKKFEHEIGRLVLQRTDPESNNVRLKFGFSSDKDEDVDRFLEQTHQESQSDLEERIIDWLNMLRPTSTSDHPKIYVVCGHGQFFSTLLYLVGALGQPGKEYRTRNCGLIPMILSFP